MWTVWSFKLVARNCAMWKNKGGCITMSGVAGAQELNGVKGRFRVRDCADTGCRQGWVQGGHPGNPMT